MVKVVKFGGSSLASSNQFKKVKDIILNDAARRVVVVSALGKENKEDHKITDLLYLTCAHLKYGVDAYSVFNIVKNRYFKIKEELKLDVDLENEFKIIESKFSKNIDEAYLVSRGEYLAAKLMAAYLNYEFIDSKDVIFFNFDGSINEVKINEVMDKLFKINSKLVIPGFYGSYPDGEIHLFSRGGSDVTGSVVAKAISANIYENWTDVSGFLVTDPKIVDNPKQIKEISYEELRELSYMGANVLHEDTIFPVQELDIPINIRNTNYPKDVGTIITSKCTDTSEIITGITGKKGYDSITIIKKAKVNKTKVVKDVLDILLKYDVCVEHIPSSIDTFSLIVEQVSITKKIHEIIFEIEKLEDVQEIILDHDIALVAVVGRNMATKPGISAKIFSIFGNNKINVKVIAQASQELSIIVGVENKDFEKAIKAVYDNLVK